MTVTPDAHRVTQAQLARLVAARVRGLWVSRVDPHDVAATWRATLPAAGLLIDAAAVASATESTRYVTGIVADAGYTPTPVTAWTARDVLDATITRSTLMAAAGRVFTRMRDGASVADAVATGEWLAGSVARDITLDVGRETVSRVMVAQPAITGWVRVPSPTACGRCAVLSGRVYETRADFDRHPGCDCGQRPVTRGDTPDTFDVSTYFDGLTAEQQDRRFGASNAQRIRDLDSRDPASIARVVNAERSMWRRRAPLGA